MRKNKKTSDSQISMNDLNLSIGDKLYKDNQFFAQVSDVSENLYMLIKNAEENIAMPYRKEVLINYILSGKYTIKEIKF